MRRVDEIASLFPFMAVSPEELCMESSGGEEMAEASLCGW